MLYPFFLTDSGIFQPELSEAKEQQRTAKSEYSKAKGNLQRKDAEIKSLTDEIQRIRETDFGSIMKKKEEDERKIVELEVINVLGF